MCNLGGKVGCEYASVVGELKALASKKDRICRIFLFFNLFIFLQACEIYTLRCRAALGLGPETEFELTTYRLLQQEQRLEVIRLTRTEAAAMMLRRRGCPQTPRTLGVEAAIERLLSEIDRLRSHLPPLENDYIAPIGTEVHTYVVTRPWGKYYYNKLTATEPIFTPSIEQRNVKVIHLSRNDDARNIEARFGIERRNRLMKVLTRLAQAKALLEESSEILSRDLVRDVFEEL